MTVNRKKYLDAFKIYWKGYGGWLQIVWSPYFLFALFLLVILKPIWFQNYSGDDPWTEYPLGIIPNMVSFSLGAMAIFLSFSNKNFLVIIRQRGKKNSYLITVMTAFFHFILMQFLALFFAFILIAYPNILISAIAFFIFMYAISCGIAAAAALLDMAEILNHLGTLDD